MNLPNQTGEATPAAKRSPQPEWLTRLWSNQNVPLGTEKLFWWGVQVQSFISFARRQNSEGLVGKFRAKWGTRVRFTSNQTCLPMEIH